MVSRKTLKKIDLENVRSESYRYVPLQAGLPLLSSCCKGEACLPDRITRGKPRVQNGVSRGRCGLRKTEKIFSANNEKNLLRKF